MTGSLDCDGFKTGIKWRVKLSYSLKRERLNQMKMTILIALDLVS